jgi:hypothetical protein
MHELEPATKTFVQWMQSIAGSGLGSHYQKRVSVLCAEFIQRVNQCHGRDERSPQRACDETCPEVRCSVRGVGPLQYP